MHYKESYFVKKVMEDPCLHYSVFFFFILTLKISTISLLSIQDFCYAHIISSQSHHQTLKKTSILIPNPAEPARPHLEWLANRMTPAPPELNTPPFLSPLPPDASLSLSSLFPAIRAEKKPTPAPERRQTRSLARTEARFLVFNYQL